MGESGSRSWTLLAIVLATSAVGGCGGEESPSSSESTAADEQQIRELAAEIRSAATEGDGARICDVFTDESIEQFGGLDRCEEHYAGEELTPSEAKSFEIVDIAVDGGTATLTTRTAEEETTAELVKEDDEWLVDATR